MKKELLLLLSLVISTNLIGQHHKCYTDQANVKYSQASAIKAPNYQLNEAAMKQWIAANQNQIQSGGSALVATIPVVFHVVYKNAAQNIADSNLFRQIDVLNECFRKQNANFSQTRPIFDTIAADVDIEFCLATIDPSGAPTTGITRTQAPAGTFFDPLLGFDNVKANATGGKDPWPNDQYLNVWVCDMSFLGIPFVLGYATFPGGDPLKDGVVIQHNFIGFISNGTTSNAGRTTVHEVGHWLGLRHIWGDGQGSAPLCDSTDYVDDTPNADTASQQTCVIKNSCSNESPYWTLAGIDPPDMIENYMDYSYDNCMTMFTNGQKARMLGFLNTVRSGLLISPGCATTGIVELASTEISIFPNPTQEFLHVETSTKKSVQFTLYDLSGRVLKSFMIESFAKIDIREFASGILFYEAKETGKTSARGRILISK